LSLYKSNVKHVHAFVYLNCCYVYHVMLTSYIMFVFKTLKRL